MDDEISFGGGSGVRLAGTLAMPPDLADRPGVVLVGGSGPSTRDGGGFLAAVREYLRDAGLAVLSYDKRGAGRSAGHWASATVDDLARDAIAALTFLRSRPNVDPARVSLFGHSEGGWVALRAAVRVDVPPAVLVLNSCPAVSFIDSEVFAQPPGGESSSASQDTRAVLTKLAELADAGLDVTDARHELVAAAGPEWLDGLAATGFRLDDETWAQFRAWCRYDPVDDLRRCAAPTVALLGADDPLVPVPESVAVYDETAVGAGRPHTNRVFPGAGHRMGAGGDTHPVPGYLRHLAEVLSRGRLTVVAADLDQPALAAFLQAHLDDIAPTAPPQSQHALNLDELRGPGIRVWTAADGDQLVGVVALAALPDGCAELKSMRTDPARRGQGIASMLLTHALDDAARRAVPVVFLETGSMDFFSAARSLYRRFGFAERGPFGAYVQDPNSVYMQLPLDDWDPARSGDGIGPRG